MTYKVGMLVYPFFWANEGMEEVPYFSCGIFFEDEGMGYDYMCKMESELHEHKIQVTENDDWLPIDGWSNICLPYVERA